MSKKSLDRAEGARDRRQVLRIELAEKLLDPLDAHVASARERAKPLRRRMDAHHTAVGAVGHLASDAGSLHFAHQPTHRGRTDLLGRRELSQRLGSAHEHRESGELRRRDAGERVSPARAPEQMDRRGVQAVGDLICAASTCTSRHTVILVSKAN